MPISLLFYRGDDSLSARVIRRWTRSPFAHVAPVVWGQHDVTVYDAFWRPGVTRRPWRPSDADAARVDLPGADTDYWRKWLEAQVGKPYDRQAIVACGLCKRLGGGWHIYDSKQGCWTCSRLSCVVAGKTEQAWGLHWPVTPGDLYNILLADRLTGPTEGD